DKKWVYQSIRDIYAPKKATIKWISESVGADGYRKLACDISGKESLSHIEILEDDDVVYALDRTDEFRKDPPNDNILFRIETRSLDRQKFNGTMTFKGIENGEWFQTASKQRYCRFPIKLTDGTSVKIRSNISWWQKGWFFTIPRNEIDKTILEINTNLLKTQVVLKEILKKGIYSWGGGNGASFTLSEYYKQPDIPIPFGMKSAKFTARVKPELGTSLFHLRLVTMSGKIYRSAPLTIHSKKRKEGACVIVVYSDSRDKAIKLKVGKTRVPDIRYEFTRKYGNVLRTSAGRPFWGHLGSYIDVTTGRFGSETGGGNMPFRQGKRHYPKGVVQTYPSWVEDDGRLALKFNGGGQFALLPPDAFPVRAGFTLELDVKPEQNANQIIFAHHGYYIGSLILKLNKSNELYGTYCSRKLKVDKFNSGLKLKLNEWNKVMIVYDLNTIKFQVNGVQSAEIPCSGPGLYTGTVVIGGFGKGDKDVDFAGKPSWFKGKIRAVRIFQGIE
ncbi:MAG: LamG domain-containing protein, partial [Victivallales bacterium]|nr:LamG domain-containing protein [Victivallales bacterium]